jgi:hypothetical protein
MRGIRGSRGCCIRETVSYIEVGIYNQNEAMIIYSTIISLLVKRDEGPPGDLKINDVLGHLVGPSECRGTTSTRSFKNISRMRNMN